MGEFIPVLRCLQVRLFYFFSHFHWNCIPRGFSLASLNARWCPSGLYIAMYVPHKCAYRHSSVILSVIFYSFQRSLDDEVSSINKKSTSLTILVAYSATLVYMIFALGEDHSKKEIRVSFQCSTQSY